MIIGKTNAPAYVYCMYEKNGKQDILVDQDEEEQKVENMRSENDVKIEIMTTY